MSWAGVLWAPAVRVLSEDLNSEPNYVLIIALEIRLVPELRRPRNLRGIFAGCVLFLVVLLFGVDLMRSCQALGFSNVYEISGYCSLGSYHHRHYCCLFFSKSFYFDFQVLVLSDLFHFFLIDSAITWYCHINQPHLLLLNHCCIWYVMNQLDVCLF